MLLLAWIENNLIVLGLVAVFAGLSIGVLCSEYQARRARAALRPTKPGLEEDGRAPRLVTAHHLHSGAEPIAPTGARRPSKVPTPPGPVTPRR